MEWKLFDRERPLHEKRVCLIRNSTNLIFRAKRESAGGSRAELNDNLLFLPYISRSRTQALIFSFLLAPQISCGHFAVHQSSFYGLYGCFPWVKSGRQQKGCCSLHPRLMPRGVSNVAKKARWVVHLLKGTKIGWEKETRHILLLIGLSSHHRTHTSS